MNNGRICISICSPTLAEMHERAERARGKCDLVELRLDCLNEVNASDLGALGENTILTLRPREQGGNGYISLDERLRLWTNISGNFGADLEEDVIGMLDAGRFKPLLVSFHDFSRTPDVSTVFARLANTYADVIKIAVTATDITDTISIWKLIDQAQAGGKNIIPIAMGEAGKWTRILGLAHGAYLTYASLDSAGETAPGQITAQDMIDVYRVKELDRQSEIYGIIAGDTTYSMSPYLHNAAFKAAGLNAAFVPLQVQDLDAFMRRMVLPETHEIDLNFRGFAVTNPHKEAIMKYIDVLYETARQTGAVNTVSIVNGKLHGHNTDADGFATALKDIWGWDFENARVALVGSGGAARACAYVLKGPNLTIVARNGEKSQELAMAFDAEARTLTEKDSFNFSGYDIVVNATPLGTRGKGENETIATAAQLQGVKLVYDLVYNPAETRLLREAKLAGAQTLGGFEMLMAQATEQFKIWTGKSAPIDEMREAAHKRLDES